MSVTNRPVLILIIILLFVPVIALQYKIDPQRHQFEPKLKNLGSASRELPIEFALGAATGFSQAIAGLLWVRTDEFFDKGDYDAIIPMVRIITWLDPHNIDVYETGSWHMDYNFTDSEQRSDRRYVPVAIALLQEGIANNPDVPELYADLAFTHYFRKVGDYPKAVEWYEKAEQIPGWDVTKFRRRSLNGNIVSLSMNFG
jgi:tetratricopeptide (TPR) repeat protein